MSDEMKIVIVLKADRVMVGVQAPDCDPLISTFQGDLNTVIERIPGLVEDANRQWDSNPRFPKADIPIPETTTISRSAQTSARASKPKEAGQRSFF